MFNAPSNNRTFDHTIEYARTAMEQICTLRTPADPQTFQLWYAYAASYNPQLNMYLNDALTKQGALSIEDLDFAQNKFLSLLDPREQAEAITPKITHEIDALLKMVDLAISTSDGYQAHLAGATKSLSSSDDRTLLLAAVQRLVASTAEVEKQNGHLKASLTSARDKISHLSRDLEDARAESLQDPRTKLANRRRFDESLPRAAAASTREASPLSLLMCDVDHFKRFNDNFGHKVGDSVLRLVAYRIKQAIRGRDIAARYGGEEFAIILPDTTLEQAKKVAENIRAAVSERETVRRSTGESLGFITISIGAAELLGGESVGRLIERADSCLYVAKRQGRDRVVAESKTASLQTRNANLRTCQMKAFRD